MKYNDTNKDNDNIEIYDLDIKSHLDASLDLSGISVSEDLINRTLEAIKKQETDQTAAQELRTPTDINSKKVIPWNHYIRGFAGIAAAAVILVAGYNVINNSGAKKDSSSNMESTTTADNGTNTDEAAEESTMFATQDAADTATKAGDSVEGTESADIMDDAAVAEVAPQFSIAAGIIAEEEGTYGSAPEEVSPSITSASVDTDDVTVGTTKGTTGSTSTEDAKAKQPDSEKAIMRETTLTFRNIFLSEPEKAQYITLTDHVNGTTITITEQSEILDFYDVMDKHQFTYGTEDTLEQSYTVEIGNPEADATYVMTVGDYITVSYTGKESSSQSIYDVQDKALLTQDLNDFIAKYGK